MRIDFVLPPIEYYSPLSGGALSTIAMQSAKILGERGHDVGILTPVDANPTYEVGRVVPLGVKKRSDLHFFQRALSAARGKTQGWDWAYYEYYLSEWIGGMRANKPEVAVFFNDLVSPKYVKRHFPGIKTVVWLQNQQRTSQKNVPRSLACIDHFLTCSQFIKDWTVDTYAISGNNVTVALSGVDLEAFYPRQDRPETNGDAVRVLFIGRVDPNKGPDIVLDAVARLQAEGLPVTATVAGDVWFYKQANQAADPYVESLKEKMTAVKANYLGHVPRPDVPAMIREHDVCMVLSRANEPFGLVTLEAMASGCAVISSDRGGLPEACGGAAVLVDPEDFAAVVAALRTLVVDSGRLAAQKRLSLQRAKAAPWTVCIDTVEKALRTGA